MKHFCWIVELSNPRNLDDTIWYCVSETLEKICLKWRSETGNDYLNYHKLHNIYHQRNKGDTKLIKVKKVNQNISTINSALA